MRIRNMMKIFAIACALAAIVGCGSKGKAGTPGSGMGGIADSMQFYGTEITAEQERELLAQKTYYFDFDRMEVNEKDMLSLYAHAKNLMSSPKRRIRVEGHTDEKGSREYNVALGERRAKSIANILMLKGVPQHQVSVVSYGKERPVALDHNEAAWQLNRRAEIVYEVE
jgi:peptidoglycan-associated lipoprotein